MTPIGLTETCLNKTYKVLTEKYLSVIFPIQNGLKQGNALSQLLLIYAFECVIRKIQENREGLKWNGTHQIMTCAEDVNLASENISLICDKSVTTQNLAFLCFWYRKKRLQMHF
jgi:hypothetical protein